MGDRASDVLLLKDIVANDSFTVGDSELKDVLKRHGWTSDQGREAAASRLRNSVIVKGVLKNHKTYEELVDRMLGATMAQFKDDKFFTEGATKQFLGASHQTKPGEKSPGHSSRSSRKTQSRSSRRSAGESSGSRRSGGSSGKAT